MIDGLYISAMGLQAQQYRQTVLTNNLANAQVVGFKRAIANVQSRANAAFEDAKMAGLQGEAVYAQMSGGVWSGPNTYDWSQGTAQSSNSKNDPGAAGGRVLYAQE